MQTLFCLIRHGVTIWNYEGRMQGHTDIPLSPEGIQQASLAAARLAPEPWDGLYSSTLTRAVQTAQIIGAAVGLPVQQDARVCERVMGVVEGYTLSERNLRWPGLSLKDLPGVESDEALAARTAAALSDLARRHEGQRILVVAHGGLIASFLRSLDEAENAARPHVPQRNTAITPVSYDGIRFRQVSPSDYSHLLVNGIEYTGEKGRLGRAALAELFGPDYDPAGLEAAVTYGTAVESAWCDGRMVGFARGFTDGAMRGYIDLTTTAPGFDHVLPVLIKRLEDRYPLIAFDYLYQKADRTA